jgi:hypothetical protein
MNPYIIDGEVLDVQPKNKNDKNVYYVCRVTLSNGSITNLYNVRVASSLGGIGDYNRRRLRTRKDAEFKENSFQQNDLNASVGERVLITFIHGNIYMPIIIGFMDHPNIVDELEDPDTAKPQAISQYLGIRESVDEKGNYKLIRKGVPKTKFAPASLLGSLGATASLGSDKDPGDNSPALDPKDKSEWLVVEMLDKALFRIRDPKGGVIEIDQTDKKGIYLSNNDWTSAEDLEGFGGPKSGGLKSPESTDAEYIHLDRGAKTLFLGSRTLTQITSQKDRYDYTLANQKVEVKGNYELIVVKNYTDKIDGDFESVVEGDRLFKTNGNIESTTKGDVTDTISGGLTLTVTKATELKISDDLTLNSAKDISMTASGTAGLKLSGGKVAIGSGSVELVDKFSASLEKFIDLLNKMTTAAPTFVNTAVGPGALSPVLVGDIAALIVDVTLIKTEVDTIKGSL